MTCPKCGRVHYFDSCPYCGFRATESQIVHDEPDAGDNYQPLQEKPYASPDRQPQTRRSNPPSQSPYIDYVYHDKPFLPQYDNDEFQPMYETSQPRQSKYSKILDEYESMEPIELPPKNRRKKPKKKATTIIICVIAVMVVIYLVAWATGNLKVAEEDDESIGSTVSTTSGVIPEENVAASDQSSSETPETPATAPYTTELSAGNYTSGIDFPEGTYTITAISGSGNVSSDNMFSGGINEIMAPEADDLHITEFKNAQLPKGTVLSISGVTVQISSDAANQSTMESRENTATEEVTLSDGNFIAGSDFAAGIYDVIAVSGSGNVSSDNMFDGGINAIMAPEADDLHETQYKNIEFPEGTTLTISGVEIKLVPSK